MGGAGGAGGLTGGLGGEAGTLGKNGETCFPLPNEKTCKCEATDPKVCGNACTAAVN